MEEVLLFVAVSLMGASKTMVEPRRVLRTPFLKPSTTNADTSANAAPNPNTITNVRDFDPETGTISLFS